ncbi:MAG: hypothetical protein ACI9LM_000717 [Alteromonadaceae bacterium]
MIDQKYQSLIFSFIMALLMSGIMSFVISVFNLGLVDHIIFIWLNAWGFAFTVAFPVILLVTPVVRFLVSLLVKNEQLTMSSNE